ncbi:MAG TPA: response regulator transcription factor [Candidatus Acidoferrum sp.]|nr:response regulator transcription factor [Candidatus Acidoferrum sp.]
MSKATILLADDNPGVHNVVRSLLEPQFEIVGSVYDGQTLIEATARLRPDLIVTDLAMPVLNGLEAAEKLRKSGSITPMVFLTVHTAPDIIKACCDAGGVHVSKFGMAVDLLPAIHAALRTNGNRPAQVPDAKEPSLRTPASQG